MFPATSSPRSCSSGKKAGSSWRKKRSLELIDNAAKGVDSMLQTAAWEVLSGGSVLECCGVRSQALILELHIAVIGERVDFAASHRNGDVEVEKGAGRL